MCETIYRLASWGFSLRPRGQDPSGAFDAVAAAAAKHLKRTDAMGLGLSAKRIEQIYAKWLRVEMPRGRADGRLVRGTWNRYSVDSLRKHAPRQARSSGDVFALAELMISHKGGWPAEEPPEDWCPMGDLELTAGAHRDYLRTRLRLRR